MAADHSSFLPSAFRIFQSPSSPSLPFPPFLLGNGPKGDDDLWFHSGKFSPFLRVSKPRSLPGRSEWGLGGQNVAPWWSEGNGVYVKETAALERCLLFWIFSRVPPSIGFCHSRFYSIRRIIDLSLIYRWFRVKGGFRGSGGFRGRGGWHWYRSGPTDLSAFFSVFQVKRIPERLGLSLGLGLGLGLGLCLGLGLGLWILEEAHNRGQYHTLSEYSGRVKLNNFRGNDRDFRVRLRFKGGMSSPKNICNWLLTERISALLFSLAN